MENKNKKLFQVDFTPDGQVVTIPSCSTVMEAAQKVGVYINSLCGGEGLCGKCRVIVREGQVNMKPNSFLDSDEIQKGYVIACQTEVLSDLCVEVPEETRLEGKPEFDTEHVRQFGTAEKKNIPYPHDPLCRKVFLELPKPSLTDNLSDLAGSYEHSEKLVTSR